MYWYEITLETDADKLDEGILFFNNLDIWSLNIDDPNDMITHQNQVRWDYIDEKLLERDMTKAHVKYYTEDENEALEIRKKAISDGFSCSVDKLKAEDWENGWKKYYKPFKLGEKVVIIPAWEEYELKDGELPVILDSGMAFGTGTHETTKMCIGFIEKYISNESNVLDIGTGSGILSICAARFGNKNITAIDIDELAVKIAKENVELNGFSNEIKVLQGDLFKKITGKYNVIIANIVADIIKELFNGIDNFLAENGLFITSGIITERRNEVVSYAEEKGFVVFDENEDDGWTAIVFKKKI